MLGDDLIEFLSHINRDLPKYRHCPWCRKLHPLSGFESPVVFGSLTTDLFRARALAGLSMAPCCLIDDRHWFGEKYRLEWWHVQLAMQRHHYGPEYGIPLPSLEYRGPVSPGGSTIQDITAHVVEGELILRRVISIGMTPIKLWLGQRMESVNICAHLTVLNPWVGIYFPWTKFFLCSPLHDQLNRELVRGGWSLETSILDKRILCQLYHKNKEICQNCERMLHCSFCHTDYQVDLTRSNGATITVWYCYGTGETPKDPKWAAHRAPRGYLGSQVYCGQEKGFLSQTSRNP